MVPDITPDMIPDIVIGTETGEETAHAAVAGAAIHWADKDRAAAFEAWLSGLARAQGIAPASARLASADASFRRYFRVDAAQSPTGSYIIMDAPPDKEDCASFVHVAELMADAGLSAPRVLAWDQAAGFMLLTDLGTQTMMDAIQANLAAPASANPTASSVPTNAHENLYIDAVDALVRWQLASASGVLPPYDDALLSRELALFPDWYVRQYRGITLDADAQATLDHAFGLIKASNLQSLNGARVYVHRDFMARNLMAPTLVAARAALPLQGAMRPESAHLEAVRAHSSGLEAAAPAVKERDEASPLDNRLGILDFQDAVYGPITYDIASLMRDAFLSWEEDFVLDITVRYWQKARKAGLPVGDDFGEFYRGVEWMGLQRHLKILGIFARLTLRDGKPRYLADTPRFIKYVRATCARYRQLGPLMVLLDEIEGNETRVGYTF
ncbi:MAG: aminoglycoside phosphotransferase [Polaromonas sp.]|nr:aminoglycoside phosphotransferase [Polaromonas sp.]